MQEFSFYPCWAECGRDERSENWRMGCSGGGGHVTEVMNGRAGNKIDPIARESEWKPVCKLELRATNERTRK
jgi:hypothetical protein